MSETTISLDREELKITGQSFRQFCEKVNAHKKMMQKCMIATARQKAGMPLDVSGTPLKSYTNQSEESTTNLCGKKKLW